MNVLRNELSSDDVENFRLNIFSASSELSLKQKWQRISKASPSFECKKGCHDSCGSVTTSSEEMSRRPVKNDAVLESYNCVNLGPNGCMVCEERPLICRLFGITSNIPCPNSCRPEVMIDPKVERKVHHYIANTR
ncbi:MAG: hypothetical protein ACJAS1_006842 [Oleiphilaceae bacterium]|jgi:hypothetical protein